ncbi:MULTISPECIES: hypothetical protein [unclassified Pantoea]|uniref:hypothetical protein n=1 Tax=unclassified Pantoea TaxID=2630326 RepID=UPI0024774565|nr:MULTISPECIES: hypothetical protein [unclassified Pantoea]GME37844.1 hypothetical protein ACJ3_19740 [Pantoea sp. QMID3]GME38259.1 hypothetical protein ACJ1_20310 [Pantoea sp. QMID1]GME52987.1 hypothetical protein ACJ4_11730 [Pantoea sp. QMID4]GME54329.1 hypothetical protein ACJ2_12420 [Pantoea sp. QMID2]
MPIVNSSATLKPLAHGVQPIEMLSTMGLPLVNAYVRHQASGAAEVAGMQATLDAAGEVQDETVIARVSRWRRCCVPFSKRDGRMNRPPRRQAGPLTE